VVPNSHPITPFPDLAAYDPNDYYDLRPGPSEGVNNSITRSEWFDMTPKMQKHFEKMYKPKVHPFKHNKSYFEGFANPMSMTAETKWKQIYKVKMKADYNNDKRREEAERQLELEQKGSRKADEEVVD